MICLCYFVLLSAFFLLIGRIMKGLAHLLDEIVQEGRPVNHTES